MLIARSSDRRRVLVTGGVRGRRTVALDRKTYDLEATSPSGRTAIISEARSNAGWLATVNLSSGRHSRWRLPARFRPCCSGGDELVDYPFNPGDGEQFWSWDPYAPVIGMSPGGSNTEVDYPLMANAQSHRINHLTSIREAFLGGWCFLPSGRVLYAYNPQGRSYEAIRLLLSNRQHSRWSRLDTSALGPVYSLSCEAAGTSGPVFLAAGKSGRIYQVEQRELDGSHLRIGK